MTTLMDHGGGRETFTLYNRPSYASILSGRHLTYSQKDLPAVQIINRPFQNADLQQLERVKEKLSSPEWSSIPPEHVSSNVVDAGDITVHSEIAKSCTFDQTLETISNIKETVHLYKDEMHRGIKNLAQRNTDDKLKTNESFKKTEIYTEQTEKVTDVNKEIFTEHAEIKPRPYNTDSDGWQTKTANIKKTKIEKSGNLKNRYPDQPTRKGSGFIQQRSGNQRYSQNKDFKTDAQFRRQTVVYSNRNIPAVRRQSKGKSGEQFGNKEYLQDKLASVSIPSITPLPSTPPITLAPPISQQSISDNSQAILRIPISTPPPPPFCGTFSYRDVLRKGLKTPSPTFFENLSNKDIQTSPSETRVEVVTADSSVVDKIQANSEKSKTSPKKFDDSVTIKSEVVSIDENEDSSTVRKKDGESLQFYQKSSQQEAIFNRAGREEGACTPSIKTIDGNLQMTENIQSEIESDKQNKPINTIKTHANKLNIAEIVQNTDTQTGNQQLLQQPESRQNKVSQLKQEHHPQRKYQAPHQLQQQKIQPSKQQPRMLQQEHLAEPAPSDEQSQPIPVQGQPQKSPLKTRQPHSQPEALKPLQSKEQTGQKQQQKCQQQRPNSNLKRQTLMHEVLQSAALQTDLNTRFKKEDTDVQQRAHFDENSVKDKKSAATLYANLSMKSVLPPEGESSSILVGERASSEMAPLTNKEADNAGAQPKLTAESSVTSDCELNVSVTAPDMLEYSGVQKNKTSKYHNESNRLTYRHSGFVKNVKDTVDTRVGNVQSICIEENINIEDSNNADISNVYIRQKKVHNLNSEQTSENIVNKDMANLQCLSRPLASQMKKQFKSTQMDEYRRETLSHTGDSDQSIKSRPGKDSLENRSYSKLSLVKRAIEPTKDSYNLETENALAPPPTPNQTTCQDLQSDFSGERPRVNHQENSLEIIKSAARELEKHLLQEDQLKSDTEVNNRDTKDIIKLQQNTERVAIENFPVKKVEAVCSNSAAPSKSPDYENVSTNSEYFVDHLSNEISGVNSANCVIENSRNTDNNNYSLVDMNIDVEQSYLNNPVKENQIDINVHQFKIKPMGDRNARFPDISQTWSFERLAENKKDTESLPERTQVKSENEKDCNECLPEFEGKSVKSGSTKSNISRENECVDNVIKCGNSDGKDSTTTTNEETVTNQNDNWQSNGNTTSSSNIYSGIEDELAPEADSRMQRSTHNVALAANSRTKLPASSCQIWSSDQTNNHHRGLQRTSMLNLEKPETSPLEIMLKNTTASVANNQSVQYYEDSTTTTVETDSSNALVHPQITGASTKAPEINKSCGSDLNTNLPPFNKMPDVVINQSNFIGNLQTSLPCISSAQEINRMIQQGSSITAGRTHPVISSMPTLLQNPGMNPYVPQSPHSLQPPITLPAGQDMEFSQLPRLPLGQHVTVPQQHPMSFAQPPSAQIQYPNLFDPRWSRNYPVDISQSEWLNINRYPASDRDFTRPPQLHGLSQPINMFNYPPPPLPHRNIQPPKDNVFPNFNYPPPPYQPGYRLQTIPGFMQRPPPPLPPQFNSNIYNRAMENININLQQRPQSQFPKSLNLRDSNDRMKSNDNRSNFTDENKSQPDNFRSQFAGKGDDNLDRYNTPNKFNRGMGPNVPQEVTLGDYIPKNLDTYKSEKSPSESTVNASWKKSSNYTDKRVYAGGRRNYKTEQKEATFSSLSGDSPYGEDVFESRRKGSFKSNLATSTDSNKSVTNKVSSSDTKVSEINYGKPKSEKEIDQISGTSFPINLPHAESLISQATPSVMASDLGFNPVLYGGYTDGMTPPIPDAFAIPPVDYSHVSNVGDKVDYEDSQISQQSGLLDNTQDFCSGGWRYYHETITSPSGLRIHQSTYVPYPNPCGSMPTTYLSTNDVRARIQWLGFKKASEIYSARINSQKSLRMDVTVVCSKGSAVCCNSDILGTCSTYFYERLVGRTEEYLTIFVNVPSKIMKHFLQMMSCGEAFVPINDVNDVIMKASIYLNLNM